MISTMCLLLVAECTWSTEAKNDSIRYYLPGIVVEAEPWLWPQDTLPGIVSVISIRDRESVSGLDRIVRSSIAAGVESYGGPGSPQLLTLRGSSSEQILLLLNGRRLTTAQGGGLDLSLWPSAWLSEVQIWRSGSPVKWGAEAIGGIVNLVSRPDPSSRGNVALLLGSDMLARVDVASRFGTEEAGCHIALRGVTSSGDFSYEDDKRSISLRRVNAQSSDIGFVIVGSAEMGSADLHGNLWLHKRSRGAPGMAEFPTPDARLEDNAYLAEAGFRWEPSGHYTGDWQGYFNWLHRRYFNPMPVYYAEDSHRNLAAGIIHHSQLRCFEGLSISAGGEARLDHLNSTTDGKQRQFRGSVYTESQLSFGGKEENHAHLTVNSGLRFEWTEKRSRQFCPSVTAKWHVIDKRMFLRAGCGRSYRIPDFDDLFWPQTANAVGNPDLQPERSLQTDFGLICYPLVSRLRLATTVYRRLVQDLIEWAPGAMGCWRPHNVGTADFTGLELESNLIVPSIGLVDLFEIEANYNYLRSIDRTGQRNREGNQLIRRPRHRLNTTVSVQSGRCRLLSRWHYVGMRYLTAANTKWLDAYLVGDLELETRVSGGITVFSRLINILNKRYLDIREFPVPGRRWEIGCLVDF